MQSYFFGISIFVFSIYSSYLVSYGTSMKVNFLHPLTNIPSPSYQIHSSYYFPHDGHDNKLPIGKTVTILCHLTNSGPAAFNVTAIMGSLNHIYDFRHYIQNYTYQPYGFVIKAGEELTLQYSFQVHPELEATEYVLADTVFYENERGAYATTFFNQTVLLYFPATEYDLESILQVIFSILCTAVVLVGAFIVCTPGGKAEQVLLAKSYTRLKTQNTSISPNVSDSWTEENDKLLATKKTSKKKGH